MKKVKDKEGILFQIIIDPKITPKSREKDSVQYVKKFFEEKLITNNVYPENNKIGFQGDINQVSYFIANLIESYIFESQSNIINNI